jgi:hypothetical protein
MTRNHLLAALALSSVLGGAGYAQVPADAPAGTTGLCKDGTYVSVPTKKGACHGHQGVKTWYAATTAAPAAPAPAAAPPAPAAAATPVAPAAKTPAPKSTPAATPAPGGGPGLVWVNTESNVYHCPGTKWYGTTKKGEYMSEADAKAKGNHADHGKTCS